MPWRPSGQRETCAFDGRELAAAARGIRDQPDAILHDEQLEVRAGLDDDDIAGLSRVDGGLDGCERIGNHEALSRVELLVDQGKRLLTRGREGGAYGRFQRRRLDLLPALQPQDLLRDAADAVLDSPPPVFGGSATRPAWRRRGAEKGDESHRD
jgi:hypothetical protein